MSLKVTITREDILRGKVLEAAWYPVTLKAIVNEVSKNGGSSNYVADFVVDGPEALRGTPVKHWFNDGEMGRRQWPSFFNALGARIDENSVKGEGVEVDFELAIGKSLQAYIKPGEYNGKPTNQILDFRRK